MTAHDPSHGQSHGQSPEHRKAHDLAEQALDAALDGDRAKAGDLVDQAKAIDPKIGGEMARELDEDRRAAERFGEASGDSDRAER